MSGHSGVKALDALVGRLLSARVIALEAASKPKLTVAELRAIADEKLAKGASLTRPEVAAYVGVSARKLRRIELAGALLRCPGLGAVVRYSARDVLRLASASAPKGA